MQVTKLIHINVRKLIHIDVDLFIFPLGNTGNSFELRPHPLGQSASLVAIRRLDREKISWYNLTILAVNIDENKTSTRVLSINVTDKNDNAPVFSHTNYSVTILSNLSS